MPFQLEVVVLAKKARECVSQLRLVTLTAGPSTAQSVFI